MNQIIKHVHGIPIREKNKVYIEFHYKDYERLILAAASVHVSVAQLIRLMASPCQQCGNDKIVISLDLMPTKTGKQGGTLIRKYQKNEIDH